jgi:hypothetical protein
METPKEVRAWVNHEDLRELGLGRGGWMAGNKRTGDVPVRIIPYPPPEWPEGTKLRWKDGKGGTAPTVGPGDFHRDDKGAWWFFGHLGGRFPCADYESVPITESVRICARVSGEPEAIAQFRRSSGGMGIGGFPSLSFDIVGMD